MTIIDNVGGITIIIDFYTIPHLVSIICFIWKQ